jgi:hypothetical protein
MNLAKLQIEDWRLAIYGLAAAALAGCASQRAVGLSPAVPPVFHGTAEDGQEARRTLLPSIANRPSEIGNLQPAPMIFTFGYSKSLTNCYLESSTDLLHWSVRTDYWIGTNADGTTYWNLRSNKSNSREFYRIGGEAIQ